MNSATPTVICIVLNKQHWSHKCGCQYVQYNSAPYTHHKLRQWSASGNTTHTLLPHPLPHLAWRPSCFGQSKHEAGSPTKETKSEVKTYARGHHDAPSIPKLHCAKCAPLVHPPEGHWWGTTGHKRCPARAWCANVPALIPLRVSALAVNCKVSPWTTKGSCSQSCGGGVKQRVRTVITQVASGGTAHADMR